MEDLIDKTKWELYLLQSLSNHKSSLQFCPHQAQRLFLPTLLPLVNASISPLIFTHGFILGTQLLVVLEFQSSRENQIWFLRGILESLRALGLNNRDPVLITPIYNGTIYF